MKSRREDLSGQVFGRLTVLEFAGLSHRQSVWKCACSCGTEKNVIRGALKSGATRSCGCLLAEAVGNRSRTHGLTRTPEYIAWASMLCRCADHSHKRYGGRGITVCERWRMFENFFSDMGKRPSSEHSIDRINNDGNYEPSNCRWATRKEQHENTSTVKPIGGFPSQAAASMQIGISQSGLTKRLKRGWSVERALTTPKFHRTKHQTPKAIHKQRLLKLAKHLRSGKLGHEKFDFTVVNGNRNGREMQHNGCGTAGCAIGECPIVFPNDWQFKQGIVVRNGTEPDGFYKCLDQAERFFGLTPSAVSHLFRPMCQDTHQFGGTELTGGATREQVAANIEAFVKKKIRPK